MTREFSVRSIVPGWFALAMLLVAVPSLATAAPLQGKIVDRRSGRLLPARVYLQDSAGAWHFVRSADPQGSAVEYRKERQKGSIEMHVTLSAHPFLVDVPPGSYDLTVERGKEYHPVVRRIEVPESGTEVTIELERWIDMASEGWYSGDTHVHRELAELPNVMLAEDLNVALPLTYWVTKSHTPPGRGDKNAAGVPRPEPIEVDATHVIYPVNTEYELFTVQGKQHTLGAVFVLNHRSPLAEAAPPVAPIAAAARQQGALLDLDKHSWPWSLMLVPKMQVDLFELANNHCWRTRFGFSQWTIDTLPQYMHLETTPDGFTEWGWIDFGFQTYYALLNCGFRMRPSAGTASGVHPVPLGFGRVYVHLPDGFSYAKWIKGLDAGRSFVTTGPMLFVDFNGKPPGHVFTPEGNSWTLRMAGSAESAVPLDRIEIIVNGRIVNRIEPKPMKSASGGYHSDLTVFELTVSESCWVAVRAFERRPDGRVRFAHTAPVHVSFPDRPVRPRKVETDYLVRRMEEELRRNQNVLTADELREYQDAVDVYRKLGENARD